MTLLNQRKGQAMLCIADLESNHPQFTNRKMT